jgi:PmbA protein
MDYADLAQSLVADARRAGADAADVLVSSGTSFSVTVRRGEIETLKESGSKALGVRVFVGRRTAQSCTSDFSRATLGELVSEVVAMARATGADPAAGLPDEREQPAGDDLGIYDATLSRVPTPERIEAARRAESVALEASPEITNSQGASYASGEGTVWLANSLGFAGSYRASSASLSVVPVAERDGHMERDYWYSTSRRRDGLLSPDEVGRIAAERTLRRLGSRKIPTAEVPVVFDPETAAQLIGHLFGAITGYAVFRGATFLKERLGEAVASPLVTLVDDALRPGGLGSRPFDGEGCTARRNVPVERGVLRHFLCDAYSGRKLGVPPAGCARRSVGGSPSVGPSNLYLEAGETPPEQIVAGVERGLYVTDLIGFGVNLVTGDYSQGAAGHWIESGRLTHPVHEVTVAGNLKQMLLDVDAVGSDLEFRSSVAAPTLRVARMTVGGQ